MQISSPDITFALTLSNKMGSDMKKKDYIVSWGEGQHQKCSSKTEAIKIAADLLNTYSFVAIKRN